MIVIRNLTKRFAGQEVLSKISAQVDEGDFITILGGSGSGKTTLLRCLSFQEKWDEGQLIYNGRDVTNAGTAEKFRLGKHWAFLEEKPVLSPQKTAMKTVLGGRLRQIPLWRLLTGRMGMDEHVLTGDYLEKLGLLDKAEMRVGQLSGGEKQRVALARELVKGAKIIVADEPVSGLDPDNAERIMQDLRNLSRSRKITVICTLHQAELAERFSTRIWGLAEGRIVLDVPARRLTMQEKETIFG